MFKIKIINSIIFVSVIFGVLTLFGGIPNANAIDKASAKLQFTDKTTGKFQTIIANVDVPIIIKDLEITVRRCDQTPPEEPPESTAYIIILDHLPSGNVEKIFSGWMFASSPGLMTLEHPIYDVWLLSCA